jgi:biopolymer transport protein ExbD
MSATKLRDTMVAEDADRPIDMSPMIDMVFLLLFFFIINSTAIIVKVDPEVRPPIAAFAQTQKDGRGRIVVNVREDGTFWSEKLEALPDDKAITDLVTNQKREIEVMGITPQLHLRGDKEAVFRHSRVVIRAAAAAGVNQVIFAVFTR